MLTWALILLMQGKTETVLLYNTEQECRRGEAAAIALHNQDGQSIQTGCYVLTAKPPRS